MRSCSREISWKKRHAWTSCDLRAPDRVQVLKRADAGTRVGGQNITSKFSLTTTRCILESSDASSRKATGHQSARCSGGAKIPRWTRSSPWSPSAATQSFRATEIERTRVQPLLSSLPPSRSHQPAPHMKSTKGHSLNPQKRNTRLGRWRRQWEGTPSHISCPRWPWNKLTSAISCQSGASCNRHFLRSFHSGRLAVLL